MCKGGAEAGACAASRAQRQPSHSAAYLRNAAPFHDKLIGVGLRQLSEPAPDHLVADCKGQDRSGRLRLQMLLNSQEQKNRMPEGPLRKR